MRIGNKEFDIKNKCYVMGILNVTPDSFSDGGNYADKDRALFRVEEMIRQGVDIIDIGGESTRPGYTMVDAREEIERVLPILSCIKSQFDVPVSLDTYKAKVAKAGLEAGADMINDIWGLKYDEEMASVIAEAKVPCCLMHNRQKNMKSAREEYEKENAFFSGNTSVNAAGGNIITDVIEGFEESLYLAKQAGICVDNIILDPGVGFGKTYEENLEILANLQRFHELGIPLLLGTSRKSVIGLTLDLTVDERLEGTLATTALAVVKNYQFVRVHDIKENVRVIKMLEAIKTYENTKGLYHN